MSEETTTKPIDEAAQTAEGAAKSAAEGGESATTQIMNELNQLGHKVAAAVQTAWDSEERHKAEEEIRKALRMAGERIDHVAEDLRKSDVTKDVQTQATRAAEAVQKSDVTKQVREGLLTGLRSGGGGGGLRACLLHLCLALRLLRSDQVARGQMRMQRA